MVVDGIWQKIHVFENTMNISVTDVMQRGNSPSGSRVVKFYKTCHSLFPSTCSGNAAIRSLSVSKGTTARLFERTEQPCIGGEFTVSGSNLLRNISFYINSFLSSRSLRP